MLVDVLLVVNIVSAVLMVLAVLLQRSEGGLGALGGDSGSSAVFSSQGSASGMTKATSILAVIFMATSLFLAMQSAGDARPESVIDTLPEAAVPAVPGALSGSSDAE